MALEYGLVDLVKLPGSPNHLGVSISLYLFRARVAPILFALVRVGKYIRRIKSINNP